MPRTVLTAAVVAVAALIAPAGAHAGVSISWSAEVIIATTNGTDDVVTVSERSLRDTNGDPTGPGIAFQVNELTGAIPAECQDDFGFIVCEQSGRVRLAGGDGTDNLQVDEEADAALIVELLGGGGEDFLADGTSSGYTFDGGPGNDRVRPGGGGNDSIFGGPGNDDLIGDTGNDRVEGGEGDDKLRGDNFSAPAPDIIDGGPGRDTVDDWSNPSQNEAVEVAISLDGAANDGRPGEGDNVLNIERVEAAGTFGSYSGTDGPEAFLAGTTGKLSTINAGGGDDEILSYRGEETIDAGAGNDTITAGYGNDAITGGPGQDRIFADDTSAYCTLYGCELPFGNDTVFARDGEADQIECGIGSDRAVVDAVDTVSGCETIEREGPDPNHQSPTPQPDPNHQSGRPRWCRGHRGHALLDPHAPRARASPARAVPGGLHDPGDAAPPANRAGRGTRLPGLRRDQPGEGQALPPGQGGAAASTAAAGRHARRPRHDPGPDPDHDHEAADPQPLTLRHRSSWLGASAQRGTVHLARTLQRRRPGAARMPQAPRARAMTICCTSSVPSPMVRIFASRYMRQTGYSSM